MKLVSHAMSACFAVALIFGAMWMPTAPTAPAATSQSEAPNP